MRVMHIAVLRPRSNSPKTSKGISMRTIVQALLLTTFLAVPAIASPADILDANRDAMAAGGVWSDKQVLASEYAYTGQGLTGSIHSRADLRHGWWVDNFEIGPATGANGFDGVHAWAKDRMAVLSARLP
jgi:hypothetical protein